MRKFIVTSILLGLLLVLGLFGPIDHEQKPLEKGKIVKQEVKEPTTEAKLIHVWERNTSS